MAPSTTNYVEIQQNEVEALRSIYMEDFVQDELKPGAWNRSSDQSFRLTLRAPSSEDDRIALTLAVTFPATYPKSIPRLTLSYDEGVRSNTKLKAEEVLRIKPKAMLGSEMIYEISACLQDILDASSDVVNESIPTLDEERMAQEAVMHEKAQQAETKRLKEQEQADAEEERLLSKMVEQEQARLAKRKSKSTLVPQLNVAEENVTGGVQFDQPVMTKDHDGTVVAVRTVHRKAKYRHGPVTEVFTVYPIGSQDVSTPFLILKEYRVENEKDETTMKRSIQNLESKLDMLVRLPAHPSIANPLAFRIQRSLAQGIADNSGWSVDVLTRLAERGSMQDLLEIVGVLGIGNVRAWAIQLIEGLDFYHRHGVVHGLVHSGNILLGRENGTTVVKLSDGSFQHEIHVISHGSTNITASTRWTAPEATNNAQGHITSPKDIWDFGVLMVDMLFGVEALGLCSSPTSFFETHRLSRSLEELLKRCFKNDPKKRSTAFELLPSEFLRNDDPILEEDTSPSLSRTVSSMELKGSRTMRPRQDSTHTMPSSSRYTNDFVESGRLGRGGFGEVVRARNKLDGRFYAIKKIKQSSASALSGVLSEIILLSRLNHPSVVRYYTAWIEDEGLQYNEETRSSSSGSTRLAGEEEGPDIVFGNSTGGLDFISSNGPKIEFGYESAEDELSSGVFDDDGVDDDDGDEDESGDGKVDNPLAHLKRRRSSSNNLATKTTLYIQMEYCERKTLRDFIAGNLHADNEECWRLFRQVLEGLVHIHSASIVHRDLKPENVFIDQSNNVRIGDFGLARPGEYQGSVKANTTNNSNSNFTKSIGTAFYVAPEVRSAGGGNYNEKADMYSLGIILLEMSIPLKTSMERVQTLHKIREKVHSLPPALETPGKALQGDIVMSLVKHKPSERPSSSELLHSGRIPIQIEDETIRAALAGISDSTSPFYSKLMSALFTRSDATTAVKSQTYDVNNTQGFEPDDLLLQSMIKERIVSVFRHHGAVEYHRPLLFPRSDYYSHSKAVQLLDPSGTLVNLPYDLTLPLARLLAKEQSPRKTYAFGDVYRASHSGSHPRSHGEVDFDIVSYDGLDLALREAEVIKVIDEVIDAFPSLERVHMCYHINHSVLLDAVLEFCKISDSKKPAVKEIVSKLNIGQWTWAKLRNELRSPSIAVPSTSLDDLVRFDFRDTPDKAIPRLRSMLQETKHLESAFSHLLAITTHLENFNVKRKVYINPLSSFNEKFYRGKLLFQCIYDTRKRDVFAAGGRYDRLIQEHQSNSRKDINHAVGFNFGWERLYTSMSRFQKNPAKQSSRKKPDEDVVESWIPRRCDVLIDSFDPAILRTSGVKIAQELWANDISAELVIDTNPTEDSVYSHSKETKDTHSWIVLIKQDGLLKVRSMIRKEDYDLRSTELIGWLRGEIRDRDRSEGRTVERTRLLRQPSQQDPSLLSSEREGEGKVKVLISQTRSKKSNRRTVIEEAQTRAQELVHSFLDGPIAAIETKDDIFEGIRETRLSDPDSWRKLIQGAPLAERQYLGEVHALLGSMADEARGGVRNAFVYNFRTRACIFYDLGRG